MVNMATHMDRIKLVVVGDSAVGKSSLIKGIVNQVPDHHPHSTIGCTIEVLVYSYTSRHGDQRDVFLEFWEVGGGHGHKDSRNIFYNNPNGLILVHDLSNRKSFLNLKKWLQEVMNSGKQELMGVSVRGYKEKQDYNSSSVTVGSIPILVVGTKEDQGLNEQSNNRSAFHIGLIEDSDVFFCEINSLVQAHLLPTSNKWNVLNTFFDKVIENRFCFDRRYLTQESDHSRGRKR